MRKEIFLLKVLQHLNKENAAVTPQIFRVHGGCGAMNPGAGYDQHRVILLIP